jgi:hypothetical protein
MRPFFIICLLWVLSCGGTGLAAETPLSSLPLDKVLVGWGKAMADTSIVGKPLTVGGKVYPKGVGLHPPGWLALQLDGQATKFRCLAAIDDETAGKGTAELRFYGSNWRLLHATGILRGVQPAVPIDLDLTGQKMLVVEMTVGGDDYGFDHVDLLDPVIVHNGAAPVVTSLPPGRELADEINAVISGQDDRLVRVIRELQRKSPAQTDAGNRQLQEFEAIRKEPMTAAAAGD